MQSPRFLAVLTAMALTWAISGCGDKYSTADNNNENLNNSVDCDGGGCVIDKVLGEACAAGSECASGHCPADDGVCCDAACDGECVACVESDTGLADGTCGAVTINTDPDNECGDEGASTCGVDGTGCNGDGAEPGCNLYDDTTVCSEKECTAGVTMDIRHCDGTGTCEAAGTTDCAPYGCDAAGEDCLTTCTGQGDCDAGSYCDSSGDCVPKQTDGTACDDDEECASSYCVDDVCCNRECDATCEACAASATGGADGVCGAVTADTDPDTECTAEGPMTCGVDGTGCNGDNVNPGCSLYDNATLCSSTSCSGGMFTSLGWCDGNGTCSAGAPTPCAPYLCNSGGTDCTTSCVSHTECDPGSYCDGTGSCVTKRPDGNSCAIGLQCANGFCPPQDGVCCDAACNNTCESCVAAKTGGTDGVCAPVTADSDPDTECSATAPTTCGANGTGCNGSATNPDCNLYDNTTTCATAGCTGGIQGGDGLCDSLGNCVQSNSIPCDPYTCNPAGTLCLTTCAAQTECMAGYFCDGGGMCQPKLADGVTCAVDFQCLNGNCPAADGICCNAPCGGTCEACLATKTGGADGVCGQVTVGTDPDTECAPDVCNGAGSCRCTDGSLNGAESAIDCGGGVCNPCAPGQTCNAGTDCTSGNCPTDDGVCCNLPCDDTCEACLAAKTGGTDGTCGPITAGTDPDPDCGADVCNGFGLCRCTDGLLNGAETDTDCGGGVCVTCANGQTCLSGTDCTNGNCPADDLVCCDDSCTSLCESCLGSSTGNTDGTCDLVLTDTDPDNECGDSESCDGVGACYDPCPTVGCFADADCTPGATGDLCVDPANDCLHATCEGATPGTLVESGAPMTTDFTTWQSDDDESDDGGQRWYCNTGFPVSNNGVLTDWELYVDGRGTSGEVAQLLVLRCTGGGGTSRATGCTRVGIGPVQSISGNGLNTFTLAGSIQQDGAQADGSGIVVETGDFICADSDRYDIGVDCNGSSNTGGCSGPDWYTQFKPDADTRNEPFDIDDSNSDGTLMIKAYGSTAGVPGVCADDTPEPDMGLCTDGGGDTCCGGACVNGPGGAGTCP
jgi:hypothetical protein